MLILYEHDSEEEQRLCLFSINTIARRDRAYTYPL